MDRLIFCGEASLRTAFQHFVEHYHPERNHARALRTGSSTRRRAAASRLVAVAADMLVSVAND